MTLPAALPATLAAVAEALHDTREPWWLIGSAAVALHTGDAGPIGDVDVLLSMADAAFVFGALGIPLAPGSDSDRFTSRLFGRWTAPPLPVEFMAGFRFHDGDEWTELQPRTRVAFPIGAATVYAPDRAELAAVLRRFGRAKDLARAALLFG